MIRRPFWRERIAAAWRSAPVAWLMGVRRSGKTVLAGTFDADVTNCDLPSSQRRLEDPEAFFRASKAPVVILDEVHQLPDPSRVLKIAADAFPHLRVLATGSSTLAATQKFKDSLTGRKRSVLLTPVLWDELEAFGVVDIERRLLRGGLPPALLPEESDPEFFSEWMDSYFARDVQELFQLGKRAEFLRLLELVLRQSGGLGEVTSFAKHVGVSRPTVLKWLEVLQVTNVLHLLRPYAHGGRREIVAQPKLYAFDTGFVCHARGWTTLRLEDRGGLWEHLVLDVLLSLPAAKVHYWRDKQRREVDFVLPRGRDVVDAIECKWSPDGFAPDGLAAFRANYPKGHNFVVCHGIGATYRRRIAELDIIFCSPAQLREKRPGDPV